MSEVAFALAGSAPRGLSQTQQLATNYDGLGSTCSPVRQHSLRANETLAGLRFKADSDNRLPCTASSLRGVGRKFFGSHEWVAHRKSGIIQNPASFVESIRCQSVSTPSENGVNGVSKDPNDPHRLGVVMKFGGSSLKDAERLMHVVETIKTQLHLNPVVVLSAMGSTTNNLLAAGDTALKGVVDVQAIKDVHYKACGNLGIDASDVEPLLTELEQLLTGVSLIKELSKKTKDYLVSFGERLSVRIFAKFLTEKCGVPARFFDAFDLGMLTDSEFMSAKVDSKTYELIRENIATAHAAGDYRMPIVTGFIGKDPEGRITTLGRGGSDLTASVIGVALGCDEIQVWKDVDGLMTTDPRIVSDARTVSCVSFEEASELAYFGAKVLHPLSIIPAMKWNVPVRVKNSYAPMHPGTIIVRERTIGDRPLLVALTLKRNVTVVDIISSAMLGQHGFLAAIFAIFRDLSVSVDVVATSEVSVSLTLDQQTVQEHLDEIIPRLKEIAVVQVNTNKAIVSLIGDVERSSEILKNVFEVLYENKISVQMMSQGASKVNISFCVEDSDAEKCAKALHGKFFPPSLETALSKNGAVAAGR